jgi:hypothetical protein
MTRWAADIAEIHELKAEVASLLKVAEAAAYLDYGGVVVVGTLRRFGSSRRLWPMFRPRSLLFFVSSPKTSTR